MTKVGTCRQSIPLEGSMGDIQLNLDELGSSKKRMMSLSIGSKCLTCSVSFFLVVRTRDGSVSVELKRQVPLGRWSDAREVALACLYMASGKASSYVTGTVLVVDGGASLSRSFHLEENVFSPNQNKTYTSGRDITASKETVQRNHRGMLHKL